MTRMDMDNSRTDGNAESEKRFSNEFWLTVLIFAIGITASVVSAAALFETQSHAAKTYMTKELSDERWKANDKGHEKFEQKLDDFLRELRDRDKETRAPKKTR